ncbi:hypothetical protein QBZ16_004829 [Prototheca wickerhamii]|uniref:DNA-directed RNA polymerase subunit n=1 Tax=Prototheca wickerhamii TaxID=3111 RepID=A0AAD9IIG2_PROWI|nr:hypothetical protein QBZ16_004829 [Prototheca wickerhamii]
MSSSEIIQNSELQVYERALYKMPDRRPQPNGVLDARLGVSNKRAVCETCGQPLSECTGHFGHIKLELPVFHIGYLRNTIQILQCICKTCARVLLPADERRAFLRRFRSLRTERVQRDAVFRRVLDRCKRVRQCPHCGADNGVVKKVSGTLKIVHDGPSRGGGGSGGTAARASPEGRAQTVGALPPPELTTACRYHEGVRAGLSRVVLDDLNPLRVRQLFQAIPMADLDVEMDAGAGSNEDDITMRLANIVETNATLRQDLAAGAPVSNLVEHWDYLQFLCATVINSDLPGLNAMYQTGSGGMKPTRGLVQRLKGKQGRFRGNLSGKRVDFSGRTVISPDPNLHVSQVCVPQLMAQVLTYPERVTTFNIDKLRRRVLAGASTWPGAAFVIFPNGDKVFLKYGDRRRIAAALRVGDVVERHLEDNDVVLFNRQPSLHRMSIMAHRARVMPGRTLRFNECVCSPYNADFDGDEMNIHVPQTEEARADAIELMGVVRNLCTPKNGEILVAATQDFLTSAFLLTSRDKFLTRAQLSQLVAFCTDNRQDVDLPPPAVLRPVELWTGKQAFGLLLRPNHSVRLFVNLETTEKIYVKPREHMCPNDGFVCFRNSELLSGRLGKVTLGGGNKAGLFQVLTADYSSRAAAEAMTRLAKLSARFIGDQGFSIGIDDVTPAATLVRAKAATLEDGYGACDEIIAAYSKGTLALQPGCDAEQSLEASVTGVLNGIREAAAKVCMGSLHHRNSPLIMSQCGSKGSPINIAQMVACVGQQSVGGKRAPNGFTGRSLPHFPRGDCTPAGKGFTGYMSRRLMKALEDLYAHYDGTVRNASGGIVQIKYGEDGLDPVGMEGKGGEPLALQRLLSVVCAGAATGQGRLASGEKAEAAPMEDETLPDNGPEDDWAPLPEEAEAAFERELAQCGLSRAAASTLDLETSAATVSEAFSAQLRDFLQQQVDALRVPALRALRAFVRECAARVERKAIEPGATVGAFGAQSIGEPGTQMTLKTFHFAGVASMNVTLGVPRLKEIINAAKNISTPLMQVALAVDTSEQAARIVKGRLERTLLGGVASSIQVVFSATSSFVRVRLDLERVRRLQLGLDAASVRLALLEAPKLKLRAEHVAALGEDVVEVRPPGGARAGGGAGALFALQQLERALPEVIVCGIPTVERAVISKAPAKDGGAERFSLIVEGTDLAAVLGTPGVAGLRTTSNHVAEIVATLGIEAARSAVMEEIAYTMGQHGMAIDPRHTMLLADSMTARGEVLGITRFGIAKMKDSVLMLASFEKTTDHLFDAALHGRVDDVTGVSESIIMGIPMPVGTGLMKILQRPHADEEEARKVAAAAGGPVPTVKQQTGLKRRPGPLLAARPEE